jgi:hypothetical protein
MAMDTPAGRDRRLAVVHAHLRHLAELDTVKTDLTNPRMTCENVRAGERLS